MYLINFHSKNVQHDIAYVAEVLESASYSNNDSKNVIEMRFPKSRFLKFQN